MGFRGPEVQILRREVDMDSACQTLYSVQNVIFGRIYAIVDYILTLHSCNSKRPGIYSGKEI